MQTHCATLNVNSGVPGEGGDEFKLLTLIVLIALDKLLFSVLFSELKNNYKHMVNSP